MTLDHRLEKLEEQAGEGGALHVVFLDERPDAPRGDDPTVFYSKRALSEWKRSLPDDATVIVIKHPCRRRAAM